MDEGFTTIFDTIVGVTRAVERVPGTFSGMPEESLRYVLLVALDNQFGPSGDETFSRHGKTDTLITYEGDTTAVFIAECKWWRGATESRAGVDQILGCLVWRDTKAAVVLFIDRADVTSVIQKVEAVLTPHARTSERLSL